jgi:Tfp pilus assembly PilM family ATPase
MSREELEESIDWHAEEHIPYDLADVSLDYQVTAETPMRPMFDRSLASASASTTFARRSSCQADSLW